MVSVVWVLLSYVGEIWCVCVLFACLLVCVLLLVIELMCQFNEFFAV